MNENNPDVAPPTERDVSSAKKRRRPPREPLKVRVELVVVDGEAGKELMRRQATAVRDALQWFAGNPPSIDGDDDVLNGSLYDRD
jgi:hypothetical protein